MRNTQHMPHIDGLRAVAVITILLFHLDLLDSGFIGVDIFFVISGYLITGQIIRQNEQGTFTLSDFFIRRIRRLLPALLATLAATLIAGYFFLPAGNLVSLADSVLASLFFFANIYFWQTTGYFAELTQSSILLHTWSLSVEEQFYLIWPLLLLGIIRFTPQRSSLTLFILLIISVTASHISAVSHPDAAFYLLPFRLHEFFCGALIASTSHKIDVSSRFFSKQTYTVGGLGLLAISFYTINSDTVFPGLPSLLPSVATALILLTAENGASARILKSPALRVIGRSSYSIYLIHWPLIAFTLQTGDFLDSIEGKLILFISSLILGYVSYRLIEQPFRNRKNAFVSTRALLTLVLLAICVLSAAALTIQKNAGFPGRYPSILQMDQNTLYNERERYWNSFGHNIESQLTINELDNFTLVIGNSHAQDLVYALRQNDFDQNIKVIITPFKCFNFGVGTKPSDDKMCAGRRGALLRSPLLKSADRIFLHEDFNGEWLQDLASFLVELRTKTTAPIYLFGPRLVFKRSVLSLAHEHGSTKNLDKYAVDNSYIKERGQLNTKIKSAFHDFKLSELDVHYIELLSIQCGSDLSTCDLLSPKSGEFLYFDKTHFTKVGAKEFGERLRVAHPHIFSNTP